MVNFQLLFHNLPIYIQQFILEMVFMLIPIVIYSYYSGNGIQQTLKLNKPKNGIIKSIFDKRIINFIFIALIISNICIYLFSLKKGTTSIVLKELNIDKKSLWIQILFIGILTPIIEELTFRGAILTKLNTEFSIKKSIVINGLIFGIAHGNFAQFVAGSLLGGAFSYSVYKTNSIFPVMFYHMFINILSVIFTNRI